MPRLEPLSAWRAERLRFVLAIIIFGWAMVLLILFLMTVF